MSTDAQAEKVATANEVKLKDLDQSDPELEKYLRYSSVFYILVSIIIGLPIWYFTTTTYRADLPFNEIDQLSTSQIEFSISIDLVFFDKNFDKLKLPKFERDVFTHLYKHSSLASGFRVVYKGKARLSTADENEKAKKASKISDLDASLTSDNLNQLRIYVLNAEYSDKFLPTNDIRFLNSIYLTEAQIAKSTEPLVKIILQDYLHIDDLAEVYKSKRNQKRKLPGKNQLRQVDFDTDYELTFSLINPKPEEFKIETNMESSIKSYFSPILSQLSSYTNISVKSQNLFYSDFDQYQVQSKKAGASNQAYYFLNPSDLSIMTNFIESRLGSQIQQSSTVNFVTYVPLNQPLRIQNPDQRLNDLSAFLVPRWGGIYIYNHLSEKNQDMKVFLTQFLQLVGINLHELNRNEARSNLYSSEIYSYLLTKTLDNLLNSLNTLESLSSLLEKIGNMVIGDDIGKQVHLSVDSIKQCLELVRGGKISEAFQASKIAFMSSEKAFFDPSLLELLYFPEDQKFAIYIPLFIPVGLPLLISMKPLIKIFKKWRQERKAKTE